MRNMATDYLTDNAEAGGARVTGIPEGRIVVHPTLGWQIFNWAVVNPRLPEGQQAAAVKALAGELAKTGRRPSLVVPDDAPWLAETAREMGLNPHEEHSVYLCEAPQLTSPGRNDVRSSQPSIVPAADRRAWLELICDGFEIPAEGRPPFRAAHQHIFAGDQRATLFEAVLDGQRVGAASLWLMNGIAGLNTATVVPTYRRQGVHSAMFAARIAHGLDLGAQWFATETAEPPVERVAARWGFRQALRYRYWF